MMRRRTALALPAVLALPRTAFAWPLRPLRIVLPFPAGSTADAIIRQIAAPLGTSLGQPVVIDNRPGNNGTVGLAQGLRAAPDGYTLSLGSSSNTAAAPYMVRNLPYDPLRDLVPIVSIYAGPTVMLAGPGFPVATNLTEALAEIRERPGHYGFGFPHATGIAAGQTVASIAGLRMTAVPYRSGPQMLTDLLGGTLPLAFTDVSSSLPLIQANRVRVFGISAKQRSPIVPDIPTFAEVLGQPVTFVGWGGLVAPAGTPREIVDRINGGVNRILAGDDTQAFLRRIGADSLGGSPEDFAAFIRAEGPLWTTALRAAGIEPE